MQTTVRRSVDQLAREDFETIPRYAPDVELELNLADNTNLWGTPPAATAVLREAAGAGAFHYPDHYAHPLKQVAAALAGVPPECVVTGNGSDDVLDCAVRAFAAPGDAVAHPNPTFVMLPVFSRINSLVPVPVPLKENFEIDADAMLATGARIIYLCSPNNPVPVATSRDAIRRVIAGAPGLVILDEAYVDFAGESGMLGEAPALARVLVCRTLSKAYGLAGLRVGYAAASSRIVEVIEKSRGPYKVNTFAQRAAVAALTTDREWVATRAREAVANRDRLAAGLHALGFAPLPSSANFLLVPSPTSAALVARLRARGIAIRAFRDLPAIGDAFRITAGPWPMMERALGALRDAR